MFSPVSGEINEKGEFENAGTLHFDPPGKPAEGNDLVLILDSAR